MHGDRTVPSPATAATADGSAERAGRDYYLMAEVAERLDICLNTAYGCARRGEFPFPVHRAVRQYRIPKATFDRWLNGERLQPEPRPSSVTLTLEDARRLRTLLHNAGSLLKRFEAASPWLPGGLHYAADLLAAALDLERGVLDAE